MKIKAPAKINIYLKILGKRPDGYHEVRTIMVPIDLFDELNVESAADGIVLRTNGCDCSSEDNLAYRAAKLFLEECGLHEGVSIDLKKNIPVGAGLGGGSSDAASVLLAMNDLFSTGLNEEDLMCMASKIGADCPYFILSEVLLMGSRGDEVIRKIQIEEREYLLVVPSFKLSTTDVYFRYNSPLTLMTDSFKIDNIGKNVIAPEQCLENDLETAAFGLCPELGMIKAELLESGASGALMSGSGSSVFGVFEDRDHLCIGMSRLKRREGYSYIPTTRLTGEQYGDYRGKGVYGQG